MRSSGRRSALARNEIARGSGDQVGSRSSNGAGSSDGRSDDRGEGNHLEGRELVVGNEVG